MKVYAMNVSGINPDDKKWYKYLSDKRIEKVERLKKTKQKAQSIGAELLLRHAIGQITGDVSNVKWDTDENGNVTTVYCTYDPETRGGQCERKIKGTIHWLNVKDAKPAEIRLYEDLLLPETEGEEKEFTERLNPNSLTVVNALVEPELAEKEPGYRCQFMRTGYFCADSKDSRPGHLVFNRAVSLKDSFKK